MECRIGVEIGMTIEAGDALALVGALAIFSLVELLLGKGCEQNAQTFHLHWRDQADHLRIKILDREEFAPRDIAKFGMGGEKDRRRELGSEMTGEIKVYIEAAKVAF